MHTIELFEYLAIAFGLLFTIAALRLIGGIPCAIEASRRYGVHLGWVLAALFGIVSSFWSFWSLSEVERWTFPRFVVVLSLPGLIYYLSALLIPANPEEVASWRDHFFAIRVRLFTGFGIWAAVAALNGSVNLGMSWTHPARAVHAFVMGVAVVGTASASPKVHAGLLFVVLTVGVGLSLAVSAAPSWMAP